MPRQSFIEKDSQYLIKYDDGLRFGAPGWQNLKFRYNTWGADGERFFYLDANLMPEDEFKEWQNFVGKKFEENNLPFHYF